MNKFFLGQEVIWDEQEAVISKIFMQTKPLSALPFHIYEIHMEDSAYLVYENELCEK